MTNHPCSSQCIRWTHRSISGAWGASGGRDSGRHNAGTRPPALGLPQPPSPRDTPCSISYPLGNLHTCPPHSWLTCWQQTMWKEKMGCACLSWLLLPFWGKKRMGFLAFQNYNFNICISSESFTLFPPNPHFFNKENKKSWDWQTCPIFSSPQLGFEIKLLTSALQSLSFLTP